MPFPTRVIPTRSDVEEVIMHNSVANVLEKASVSNMVGLLQQMNMLSKHAAEIFGSLLKDADQHLGRISQCRQRLQALEEKVPRTEQMFMENAPAFFYDNPYTGKEWTRSDMLRGLLFRRDRASLEVNRRRQLGDPPPTLSAFDRFGDGKPCIKKFSDADFFMNEWLEAEKLRREEERRRRKERKNKKKKKKVKRDKAKKILKVVKKNYSQFGAEFDDGAAGKAEAEQYVEVKNYNLDSGYNPDIGDSSPVGGQGAAAKHLMPQGGAPPQAQGQAQRAAPQQIQQPQQPQQPYQVAGAPNQGTQINVVPPSNPVAAQPMGAGGAAPGGAAPGGPGGPGGPPSNPMAGHVRAQPSYASGPPAVPQGVQPSYANLPGMAAGGPPPQPHVATTEVEIPLSEMTPQMRAMMSMQQAQARMEQEAAERAKQAAIKEKQKQASMMMPARGNNFLASIRSGTTLKKVSPIQRERPRDARSDLLSSIKSSKKLRHVDRSKIAAEKEKEKEEETQNQSIFAILQRRKVIAESSDEESESDWGSDED